MSKQLTCLLAAILVMLAEIASAQDCPRGMLTIGGPESYVTTPGVQALNLTHGFTIECWVQPTGIAPNAGIIDKGHGSFSAYGIFVDTGSEYFGLVRRTSPVRLAMMPMDSFYNWHHIAFVFRPGDSMYLYIDSIEAASASAKTISTIDSSADSLRIGMSAAGVGFLGSIDELRIWNAPRSLATIRANLFNVVPGTDTNLVLYYTFDDGAGIRRVHDFSGHGRDGFLRGQNLDLLTSTSPMRDAAPGWHLAAREQRMVIPTIRCSGSFDTVIHVHNLGPQPDTVTSYAFYGSRAFSIVSNFPIALPADSSYYVPIDLHFEPGAGGAYNGTYNDSLSISSTNDCGGSFGIGVHATYDSVGLIFNPSVLTFDSVYDCQLPRTKTVSVTNVSLTDSVTLVRPVIPPGSGLILLTQFPRKLGPGQTMIDSFVLAPGARGPVSLQAGIQLDKCSRTAELTVTAFRQQPELSLPALIDFGAVPADLAGFTRDTVIVVTNTGDIATAIQSVTSADTMVTVLDGRQGIFRAPGDTVQIHLHLHSAMCGHLTAQIHLKGRICPIDTISTISINVTPPLSLTARSVDVGRICPTGSVKREVMIANPNDRPVRLDSIMFSTNGVLFNPPLFPYLIPANDSAQVEFLFQPALDGDYLDTAYLQMSPCGTGITVFRGSRGFKGLGFDVPVLSFGRGCDTSVVAKLVTLTNGTARTATIVDIQHYGSSRFTVTPFALPFTLGPGQSKQVAITYSPRLGTLDTGSFLLFGAEGCLAATISIRGSREIAQAKWSAAALDFDTVCYGSSKVLSAGLTDLGIDSIDIRNATVSGAGFSLDTAPSVIGGTGTFAVRFTSTSAGAFNGVLTVTVDDCGTRFTLPLTALGGTKPAIVLSDTLLDFGPVHVGDSEVRCLIVTNPGCTPIDLWTDTIFAAPFVISGISHARTIVLAPGDTLRVCVTYKPEKYGLDSISILVMSDSAPARTLSLRGLGLAPDVRLKEHALDFGYVLHDSSRTLRVHLSNVGNDLATIATSNSQPEYAVQSPNSIAAGMQDSIAVTFTPKPKTGLLLDTLLIRWSGHVDTVFLRGQGTDSGLILSPDAIEFGDVHVTDSLSLLLYITATEGTPTVKSVAFIPSASLRFSDSAAVPRTIASDHDTLTLRLTYHPLAERRDTALLLVADSARVDTIQLTGRGVEAHVQVNPDTTDFGPVVVGSSLSLQVVRIKNTGTYRLFVDSLSIAPDFTADPMEPTLAILPDSFRYYAVTFHPLRARRLRDPLSIATSSPDTLAPVILSGTGVYPLGTEPSFGYTVAPTQTRPGERDTIPVSLFGTRVAKIDADSVMLDLSFDPTMVLLHGAVAAASSLRPPQMRKLTDSTMEFTVAMNAFSASPVFSLDAEALLGPNPISYIHVMQSEPAADQPEAVTDGLYQVADCGGPVHGIIFAGNYKVTSISPNPASGNATIVFELGLDGSVTIDLYDPLGRTAKHIDWPAQKQGQHTATLDLSSLPAGRYIYRLSSLEYHKEGAVLIVR